ncbi:MAG: caspase family protein [Pseudomonadota bacterium]
MGRDLPEILGVAVAAAFLAALVFGAGVETPQFSARPDAPKNDGWGGKSLMFAPARPDPMGFERGIAPSRGQAWTDAAAAYFGDDVDGPLVRAAAEGEAAPTGDVDRKPRLRIDTDMHGAAILSLDVDAAGRFAVTGSYDKTARVWAIPQKEGEPFRLLNVLRPPIGDGNEGRIDAVAISPDGSLIAMGGWTGKTGHPKQVYLFDRVSGRMVGRLGGLPQVIDSLAFAPDGGTLVAGLADSFGVRAWRRDDAGGWRRSSVEGQMDFGGDVYALDFADRGDGDWRLAVGSYDGDVRLYDSNLELIARAPGIESGDRIYRVRFDPSGGRLAVTATNRPAIAVLSGEDLSPLYRPSVERVSSFDNLTKVAWSNDGRQLFAAGNASAFFNGSDDDELYVRVYEDGGREVVGDFPISQDTVQGLSAFEANRVLVASADPQLAILRPPGEVVARAGAAKIDVRGTAGKRENNERDLRLSPDGLVVSLPFYTERAPTWRFDLTLRSVEAFDGDDAALAPPALVDDITQVENWLPTAAASATVNSAGIELAPFEETYALAHAPMDETFLLGTNFNLRRVGPDGETIWVEPAHGVAWQVNVTPDGRFAVAAFGDGTVRWYDYETGEERLALYVVNEPEAENPRWVAWTPSGYYDAAPGAEDLIGWHVNQAKDKESLFYPASRFRELFYRPDIVEMALDDRAPCISWVPLSCDRQPAWAKNRFGVTPPQVYPRPSLAELQALFPPIVTVYGQETLPNGDVVVEYEVDNPFDAPVELDVFVDGEKRSASGARNVAGSGRQRTTIARGACASDGIILIARSNGRASPEARAPRGAAAIDGQSFADLCAADAAAKPFLNALLVGVSDYENDDLDLSFADNDARDFGAILSAQTSRAFAGGEVRVLTASGEEPGAAKATRANILAAFDDFVATSKSKQHVVNVVFFAGHGVREDLKGYYLLPSDAKLNDLYSSAISVDDLTKAVRNADGLKVVFLDACYSGFDEEGDSLDLFDIQGVSNILGGSDVRAEVFASSTGAQQSFEHPSWSNGAFTEALLELFTGDASAPLDDELALKLQSVRVNRRVENSELHDWLKNRVRRLAAEEELGAQTPTYQALNPGDVIFAEVD